MSAAARPLAHSFAVSGMHCASCVSHVERALVAIPGVERASVNLAAERADVLVRDAAVLAALPAAIGDAGFEVPRETLEFDVTGMHCASCVSHVEKALRALPGVAKASVNLVSGRTSLERFAGFPTDEAIIGAITQEGYGAMRHAYDALPLADRRSAETRSIARRALLAGMLTLPVFLLEMGGHLVPAFHHWLHDRIAPEVLGWFSALLTTAVLFGPGLSFHRKGLPGLIARRPDMNALVSLGTLAAWCYSLAVLLWPSAFPESNRALYFESAAVIVTLVLVGRWLEARSRGAASRAIERLVALQPDEARVLTGEGLAVRAASALSAGDHVEILPGQRVPADGIILEGCSHLDESMLTGEPMPVERGAGDGITGGTVNIEGRLVVAVTRTGQEGTLHRIIRLVETAQAGKLPIQSRIDAITAIFVPAVLAIAALTFAGWMLLPAKPAFGEALIHAVAVLIIACPCAMGLATPMSILVGTGRAAERGVLFRDGSALQRLAEVRRIAFDKTGTLTEGKPELTEFVVATGVDRAEALRLLVAIEAQSEHPIARAVNAYACERGIAVPPASGVTAEVGRGVSGTVDGQMIRVGGRASMSESGVDLAPLSHEVAELEAQSLTTLMVAADGRLIAAFAIADRLRDDAKSTIDGLHSLGLSTLMITGDARAPGERVQRELGIHAVIAEATPRQKHEALTASRGTAGATAFVGDGINDAAALGGAEIGIALGTGTDIAIESADLVLVSARLSAVPEAIRLARATLRNIRQNLVWAFGYNILLIPLAAGLFQPALGLSLSPAFAAGAMALSSLFVITNALRLRRFDPTG